MKAIKKKWKDKVDDEVEKIGNNLEAYDKYFAEVEDKKRLVRELVGLRTNDINFLGRNIEAINHIPFIRNQ